nr:uncharacterized protein LOC123769845 isoform X1 [Procambarus clarkii]XP_045617150.1 uncharacterized protein LOC123769845 isoform X1 [Procambarus clarkii]XP_045617151.1 uncharacterized protein LOC123769845 isoform X1 [Procambarus clarkii]XP_045617152.1 uncharacterized protein LOC123769845 isoform X1 [Procambarus clarkii]XP_045617153.1 uncharacterized protein LOC123769845 isoform X1 [Procambarus clarkii]XP_045617154.1 uncharacterized protein LOC123769845 isoform X1 [Procambarus clarkii]
MVSGVGGEAAALLVITILAILGNALLVITLLRRRLLHHPSNRLVLSLTASNLVLAVVVLPGMVACLLVGPCTTPPPHHPPLLVGSGTPTAPHHPSPTTSHTTFTIQSHTSPTTSHTTFTIQSHTTPQPSHTPQYLPNTHVPNIRQQKCKNDYKNNTQKNPNESERLEGSGDPALMEGNEGSWEGQEDDGSRRRMHPLQGQHEEDIMGGQWWAASDTLCQGAAFLANLVTSASAITVAVIALDRYLAIVRPMVYGLMVTGSRCVVLLAWCWVQALITALPPLLGWSRYKNCGAEGRCGVAWAVSPSYTAVWVLSVFLVPVIIMLVCYHFILQVARNKCRRISVGKVLGATSSPVVPDPSSVGLDGPCLPDISEPSLENVSGVPLASGLGVVENRLSVPLRSGSRLSIENTSSQPLTNGTGHLQIPSSIIPQSLAASSQGIPCRSRSVTGMNRMSDAAYMSLVPKRKLADCGRSLSFCQQPQLVRPCLRRAQSSIAMRPTIKKKLSLGGRKPSWSWEASPAKGFRTVCVVVGTHVFTWAPYSALAVAEAVLGQERSSLVPHWVTVTSTLLLFTASVFYPIIYGLYNRSIRKEIVACVCPISSRDRRRGSCHHRTSTLHSNTGSVLDFSSLRNRENEEQQKEALTSLGSGLLTVPIKTISGSIADPTIPSFSPLLLMAEYDILQTQSYNIVRKPSQDSDCCLFELSPALAKRARQPGAVMGGSDDPDSDMDTPVLIPQHYQSARRVSAPSILHTVCESLHATQVEVHASSSNMSLSTHQRKRPIIPISSQLLNAGPKSSSSLQRSRSLEKLTISDNTSLGTLSDNITSKHLQKKYSIPIIVRETHFNSPSSCERIQRRKSSVSALKVMVIPEDGGILECSEIPDSGRGSVESDEATKMRANRQISIDEGIGTDCLVEEEVISERL